MLTNCPNDITNCPYDILYIIMEYLDITSIVMVHYTSKGLQDIVKKYYQKISYNFNISNVILCSAELGFAEPLKWMHEYMHINQEKYNFIKLRSCQSCAKYGYLEMLKWLYEISMEYGDFRESICESASSGGQLDVLKWTKEKDFPLTSSCAANAAGGGHLEVLVWLKENKCKWDDTKTYFRQDLPDFCTIAVQNGHLPCVQWFFENDNDSKLLDNWRYATEYGHLNILEWLFREKCDVPLQRVCEMAIKYGHLDIAKWCVSNGYEFTDSTYYPTTIFGHLNILEWCKENGYISDKTIRTLCNKNAIFDDLNILQWLLRNGYIENEDQIMIKSFTNAVIRNKFEIFKWCFENGCKVTQDIFDNMMYGSYTNILNYISENCPEWTEKCKEYLCSTSSNNHRYDNRKLRS